jgi:exosortase/archaeosortase family protein
MPVASEPAATPVQLLTRLAALLGAVALAGGLVLYNQGFRDVEARVASLAITPFTHTFTVNDVVIVGAGSDHTVGLRITSECTASLLMLPAAILFCLYTLFLGVRIRSASVGLIVAGGIAFFANQVRLFLIAVGWLAWGSSGLWVAHILVGSVISIVAVLATLIVQVRLTAAKGRGASRSY